ncbi:glutamate racemase [Aquimarina sp. ERC-38]|uniref:glutamate racemase n=1 Tax=Aquimarina sp. ERC-38 TaxID=2949996 RepID=UPI0022478071|nr:glutamate racemase [Aquimarina sp. ERC-38]UZO81186.1 glutamate racemase [Aquimarina sp. ERC-38]
MDSRPIGVFDSGIGGTSIWKEIVKVLPLENTIYLSDSANAPYGLKSKDAIKKLCVKNTEELLQYDVKLIVVACNTATTNAISYLRERYTLPFIGIEPAIKPAALHSKTKVIGVLATKGTLSSNLFSKTSEKITDVIKILEVEGNGLVELIEQDQIYSEEMYSLLNNYLQPLVAAQMDYLVLGCSHYPYLIPVIKMIIPDHITIIDSGEAVARQTKAVLQKENKINTGLQEVLRKHTFYTNSKPGILKNMLQPLSENLGIYHKVF